MTPMAKEIVKDVLELWRAGKLGEMAHLSYLVLLCRELEGEL